MSTKKLWVVTPYFNPIGYSSIDKNLIAFCERMFHQNANICVVKLDFPSSTKDIEYIDFSDKYVEIRTSANSIIWHKEALINIAIKYLADKSDYIAWIDGDVLFPDDWIDKAQEILYNNDIVQLFKKVYNLHPDQTYGGTYSSSMQSVVWQNKIHKNWLERREKNELPFAAPGFAWAAKTDFLNKIDGLYDKAITGSSDVIFVDSILKSEQLHKYYGLLTKEMRIDVDIYFSKIRRLNPVFSYLPIDIYHLWHGTLKNRNYIDRHQILNRHMYNPLEDLIFDTQKQIYEIKEKHLLGIELKQYFLDRQDDTNTQ